MSSEPVESSAPNPEQRHRMPNSAGVGARSPRQIRLTFANSGVSATVDLLLEDAPDTCSALWRILPLQLSVAHDIWSGHLVRGHLEGNPDLKPENVLTYIPVLGLHSPPRRAAPLFKQSSGDLGSCTL